MEIGLETIIKERTEQVEKHGYDLVHDNRINTPSDLEKAGIQRVRFNAIGTITIGNSLVIRHEVAKNDGLSHNDFHAWFQDKIPFEGAIIHFTNYRY